MSDHKNEDGEMVLADQEQVQKECDAAIAKSNYILAIAINCNIEGIRPSELPEGFEMAFAAYQAKRLSFVIKSETLGYPPGWKIIVRAVQVAADKRLDG